MAATSSTKKRKADDSIRPAKRLVKKFKKQSDYHSSSSSDEAAPDVPAINLQDSGAEEEDDDDEPDLDQASSDSDLTDHSSSADAQDEGEPDDTAHAKGKPARKRNDPDAFAASMSKILSSKLSSLQRRDPVLSRSAPAQRASQDVVERALEQKARRKLREEKRAALDRGRVTDVLGASTAFDAAHGMGGAREEEEGAGVAAVVAREKRLRKTAQRGVVKLFNAVRAAQVKGEEAAREVQRKGVVGSGRREEKVTEMSKQGFLELIAGGPVEGA